MGPSTIKKLDVATLHISETTKASDIEAVLVTLTNKVNEVVTQVNKISEYLRK